MGNENEFTGIPLAVGSVKGVRSFDVDNFGRLTGVYYHSIWKPGENQAKCTRMHKPSKVLAGKAEGITAGQNYVIQTGMSSVSFGITSNTKLYALDHGLDKCGHGYYAYYDGSNDYRSDGRVSAVVEGYGETVIGTRGFRATKAKILALHIPQVKKRGFRWQRLFPLRKINHNGPMFTVSAMAGILSIVAGITTLVSGSPWGAAVLAFSALAFWNAVSNIVGEFFDDDFEQGEARYLRISENYPDIPVFDTFDEMVKAFPPDRSIVDAKSMPGFWEDGDEV